MVMAQLGYSEAQVRSIFEDVDGSQLIDSKQRAMLRFTEKLTRLGKKMTGSDVAVLRKSDFSDAEIMESVLVIAFYNLMNRFVLAVGCPVEEVREIFFGKKQDKGRAG